MKCLNSATPDGNAQAAKQSEAPKKAKKTKKTESEG